MTKSRRARWEGHVAWLENRRCAYMVLIKGAQPKRSLGRPTGRWQYNIKMDLQER
jgi:hypothetical protein